MTRSDYPEEHLGPSGHRDHADDDDATLRACWEAFAGEVEELLATNPDDMTPEQLVRLERLSDPFIDLYGYYQRSRLDSPVYTDPRLVAYLAERGRATAARWRARSSSRRGSWMPRRDSTSTGRATTTRRSGDL